MSIQIKFLARTKELGERFYINETDIPDVAVMPMRI